MTATPAARHATCDVVGLGANSVDYVHRLPAFPQPHGAAGKMRVRAHAVTCGGQTATALATCARLGLRARYVGAIGSDENGRRVLGEMDRLGIDVTAAVVHEGFTQFAVILVDDSSGERIVLWDRDDRLRLDERDVPAGAIASARLLHVDDVDEAAAIRAAGLARAHGLPVTSDLDGVTQRTEELVAAVTVPIFAEHVPEALTGQADHEAALRALRRRHDGVLVVTLGRRGALALDGDRLVHSPAFAVDAVDTTGSGDVFRGGFIFGLLRGWPLDRILRYANAAAAVSCTRPGALDGIPAPGEIERLLASGRLLE